MRYVRLINERVVADAPKSGMFGNVLYGNLYAHPEVLVEMGYKPLVESESPTIGERERLVTTYEDNGESIVQVHKVEALPPQDRTLSKMRLYEALYNRGLWEMTEELLNSNTHLRNIWNFANALQEQHPMVQQAMAILKANASLTDEQVEEILAESEAQ
jgi:hypothetical protein